MVVILYKLINYASQAVYIVIFLNMMDALFSRKKHIGKVFYYAVPVLLFWAIYYFPEYALKHATIPYFFYFLTIMVLMFLAIFFFLEGSIIEKLIYYLYYFTVYKSVVFIIGGFLYEREPVMEPNLYMLLDVLTMVFPITSLLLFRRFCLRHQLHMVLQYLKKSQVALMLYFPISLFVSLQIADPSLRIPSNYYVAVAAFLLLFNLPIFYYLYATIGENNEARVTLGKALAETNAQLSRYRYSVIMEEQARKERHELKNKYFYIQTLLKENKLEQLGNFLTEHIGELSSTDSGIYSNNSLIDYILNTKLELAKKHNIKTYTEILIPEKLNINEESFCTILLNLMDNAIEASRKEENPDIQLYLNMKNNYLIFCIKNKVSYDVLKSNPSLKTSKPDAENHGLGMNIIKRAVKNSNGIFDTSMESGYFVATVMIPVLDSRG